MGERMQGQVAAARATMALIGGIAGLSLWLVADWLPDRIGSARLLLACLAAALTFFAVLLGTLGPLRPRPALAVAAGLAGLGAGLLSWASLRYGDIGVFIDTAHPLFAFSLLVALPVPFLVAWLSPGQSWRDYPALFDHAWQIFVRYATAWGFTGIFWLILILSDQVLKIAGLNVIERLLDVGPVPFVLTGLNLGLGLAVVHELRAYVSPFLALRLLRLLLPLVLAVTAVFLVAAPLRGLSELFGGISPAATLMAMALISVTLVTSALDRDDSHAATAPVLVWSARMMALLVPVIGALAAWAVWQRVAQYGWTPARVAAVIAAAFTLAYGLGYGLAVLRGPGWRGHIRNANIWMALALIAVCGLWLTPVLNPERMSARSQLARFETGKIGADQLDLWAIGHDWGRAGRAVIATLRAGDYPERAALDTVLARLDAADLRWQFEQRHTEADGRDLQAELLAVLPVLPDGAVLPESAFDGDGRLSDWVAGCARTTPGGAPGCVALVADFLPLVPGDEVIVVYQRLQGFASASAWTVRGGRQIQAFRGSDYQLGEDAIDRILAGGFSLNPAPQTVLGLDGAIIAIAP